MTIRRKVITLYVKSQHRLKAGFPAFFVFRTASVASRQTKTPPERGLALNSGGADQ
jgi:hypothetical protein